jgi:hypothetical protein
MQLGAWATLSAARRAVSVPNVTIFASRGAAIVGGAKGKDSAPLILGHPAPRLARRVFRRRPRGRGRPPKTDAARAIHGIRKLGWTLRAIADCLYVQSLLGQRRVTEQRIGQILKVEQASDRWDRDRDAVDWWCRGLGGLTADRKPSDPVFSEFWQTKVDPLLLEHPELRPAVRDQHFQIPRGVVTDELVHRFIGRDPTEEEERVAVREALARSPARVVPRPDRAAPDGEDLSRRMWRLTVRNLILRHLWDRRGEPPVDRLLRELGERFGLSERQVRRVVFATRQRGRAQE